MSVQSQLTVFFDDPFWIGIYEIQYGTQHQICKIRFGKEPTDPQIYQMLLKSFHQFHFTEHVSKTITPTVKVNPKRRQRLVSKLMNQPSIATKAQQVLKTEYEKTHQLKKRESKQMKEIQKEQLYQMRKQKRKEKHRGH
ncbi:YjdF family protein [Beduini massiliensis]|uniref:YjdF family protein n=1 Tax=Beduini massiliensis TaxID=1585974 RepID=UPI00059A9C57|nr:YjdF family protein [Beduini massiliensis]